MHARSFGRAGLHGRASATRLGTPARPQVVREHYLRDDIYSGSPLDPDCDPSAYKLSADAGTYLVIDTNLALHQVGDRTSRPPPPPPPHTRTPGVC